MFHTQSLLMVYQKKDIQIDRKILADLAVNDQKTFNEVVKLAVS